MVHFSNGKNVASKGAAVFAVRMVLLFLLTTSALLATGCSTVSPEDRRFFYSGWVDPNSPTPGQ
jgi:hypothetical protein